MRVWGTIIKKNKIASSAFGRSSLSDPSEALMESLEQIYKELDLAEPVWVSKHARELSRFGRTKFLPDDFLEPVSFDSFCIEYVLDD